MPESITDVKRIARVAPYMKQWKKVFLWMCFSIRKLTEILLVHTVFSGTKNLKFLGPKVFALVTNEKKQLESLRKFRNTI